MQESTPTFPPGTELSYRTTKMRLLVGIVAWTFLLTIIRSTLESYHLMAFIPRFEYASPISWIVQYVGTNLLILYWCDQDARERQNPLTFHWASHFLILAPITVLFYFFRSRPQPRAWYCVILTIGLAFVLWLASLIVDVLFHTVVVVIYMLTRDS